MDMNDLSSVGANYRGLSTLYCFLLKSPCRLICKTASYVGITQTFLLLYVQHDIDSWKSYRRCLKQCHSHDVIIWVQDDVNSTTFSHKHVNVMVRYLIKYISCLVVELFASCGIHHDHVILK